MFARDWPKMNYSETNVETGDWQLKHASRLDSLQVSVSVPQYLAPQLGQPTTLPSTGLRHCQQIGAGVT